MGEEMIPVTVKLERRTVEWIDGQIEFFRPFIEGRSHFVRFALMVLRGIIAARMVEWNAGALQGLLRNFQETSNTELRGCIRSAADSGGQAGPPENCADGMPVAGRIGCRRPVRMERAVVRPPAGRADAEEWAGRHERMGYAWDLSFGEIAGRTFGPVVGPTGLRHAFGVSIA